MSMMSIQVGDTDVIVHDVHDLTYWYESVSILVFFYFIEKYAVRRKKLYTMASLLSEGDNIKQLQNNINTFHNEMCSIISSPDCW